MVEAEAYISSVKVRHWDKALRTLVKILSAPDHHPLARLNVRPCKRFKSPLQRISAGLRGICSQTLEKIKPYIIASWEPRIEYAKYVQDGDTDASAALLKEDRLLITTTAVESREGIAFGIAQASRSNGIASGSRLDTRRLQNLYTAELLAVAAALKCVSDYLPLGSAILMVLANLAILQVLNKPARQSGQSVIRQIYILVGDMRRRGFDIQWKWVSAATPCFTRDRAKEEAHKALISDATQGLPPWDSISSVISLTRPQLIHKNAIPGGIGKSIRELDTALPGKHTKALYDSLSKRDARILIQLRTGCARLNQFLARIKAVKSPTCQCGAAPESPRHYLFSCNRWVRQRKEMYAKCPNKEGNIRLFLGAKSATDSDSWRAVSEAIQAMISYVRATARLEVEDQHLC